MAAVDRQRTPWLRSWVQDIARLAGVGILVVMAACGGGSGSNPPPPPSNPAPSGLGYTSPQAFTVGQAITAMTPTVTGTVTSYSITPSLPAGLNMSTSRGHFRSPMSRCRPDRLHGDRGQPG